MDSVNRETARQHPDLAEWRRCQGKTGFYGMLSIIIGSGVAFGTLSFLHKVPKKYVELVAVASGLTSGYLLGNGFVMYFRKDEEDFFITNYLDQSSEMEDNSLHPSLPESKFGDKDFIKE